MRFSNKQLEQVKDYSYLDSNISDNGKCITEVKFCIVVAKTAFWKYKELQKSNIGLSVKKEIVFNYIWSMLAYGSKAWRQSIKKYGP